MQPTTRAQFKDYILRRLGAPVQQINVDDEQVEDRIDDALVFFGDYHYAGSEKSFYVHTVTQDDIDDNAITLPENIVAVTKILQMGDGAITDNFMSDRYQYMRAEFMNLARNTSYSLIPYYTAMTRLEDIEWLLGMTPSIRFNKINRKIEFTSKATNYMKLGNKLVFEVQAIISTTEFSKIWSDRWLKNYATALVKKQWGENLKPFGGIQLLGGITLDGKVIFDEAVEEIKELEDKMIGQTLNLEFWSA